MKNLKYIYSFLLACVLVLSACDDTVTIPVPDTADSDLWSELKADPNVSIFVSLLEEVGLDSIFMTDGDFTIFVPTNEAFASYDYVNDPLLSAVMAYHIIDFPLVINTLTSERNLVTLSGKYAAINILADAYSYGGSMIDGGSPLYSNGRFYTLNTVAQPAPTIAEYLQVNSPTLYNYIDGLDYTYLDMELSEYIGNDPETGKPIYNEVYSTVNLFYELIFNIEETTRTDFATFIMFDEEQYVEAQTLMADELGLDTVPQEWLDEVFFPDYISSAVLYGMVDFEIMSGVNKLRNTQGVNVDFDVDNIDLDSKTSCSNGLTYMSESFEFDLDKYVSDIALYPEDLATTDGSLSFWKDNVTSSHQGVKPVVSDDALTLDLSEVTIADDYWFELTIPHTFPSDNYRLVIDSKTLTTCRLSIYVNDVMLTNSNVDFFAYPDNTSEVFDMKYLEGVLYSVNYSNTKEKFVNSDNHNQFDYWVKDSNMNSLVTEYGDLRIRFEYKGASINSLGGDGFNFRSIKLIREN